MQLEGCFIITASYLNRKKQKNRRFSSKLVLRHIFFQKNFVENFFKDQNSSKFTGGLDKGGLDSVEYGICEVKGYIGSLLESNKNRLNDI